MTTNIFDGNARVMATDSRWSIEYGSWLFYLDDTGYEKIERCNGFALMFAGRGERIQEFKDWIRSNPAPESEMPAVKGMSVCMVEEATGEVAFQKHQDIESGNVLCAGSGARWAFDCWSKNRSSKQAVESAKIKDYCSGGEVKYIDFANNDTNLFSYNAESQLTIQTISTNIFQRGIAMKIQATPVGTPNLPFTKADATAANDEQLARAEVGALVANGTLSATAPCDGMHNEWSADDKANFKVALGRMFGWKN
jgi:hypothetical protein